METSLSPFVRPRLSGKSIFVDAAIQGTVAEFQATLRKYKLSQVYAREKADMFMVADIKSPGLRVSWAAALLGGIITTQDYVDSGGMRGPSLVYKPAVNSKRCLWCSPAFELAHPEVHRLLRACSQGKPKWTWSSSKSDAVRTAAARKRTGNDAEIIFLVTRQEQSFDEDLDMPKT